MKGKLIGKKNIVNPVEKFWQWFIKNEQRFIDYEKDDPDKVHDFLEELINELKPFNPWLKALIGGGNDGKHELVITADGDIALFTKVDELIGAGPPLKGWIFTAHKPAIGFNDIRIDMNDKEFSAQTVCFYPVINENYPDEVNIILTHAAYNKEEDEQFQTAGMIYLENGLGEMNTATKIDHYEMGGLPDAAAAIEVIPIIKLNDYLGWREKEFVEKYEQASKERPVEDFSVLQAQDENEKPLFATIDTAFHHWEYRPAYPWLLQIDIAYKGGADGLPGKKQMQELQDIEDEIIAMLPSDGTLHYVGHRTYQNFRSIYFYTNNYPRASKFLHNYIDNNKKKYEIVFFIRKDKYWRTMEQFYHAAEE